MSNTDFDIVCAKIDQEKEFLNSVNQDIWKTPEVQFEEFHAHAILTSALSKYGFRIQEHYLMDTAFRAEYESQTDGGPTVAILLEYDALPEIGHACGHNLIAEAGLAAAIAVKAVMEGDSNLLGKVVVLGTPAEEGGGGKIKLIEDGAFEAIDAAMMVHPTKFSIACPEFLCIVKSSVEYKGKEAHAAAYPWEGRNALDAAVACYNNISLLRQQIKPTWRIHAIITKGGMVPNIIPAQATLQLYIRTPTVGELNELQSRIEGCIKSAAVATGCDVSYYFDPSNRYENLITSKILGALFESYAERCGLDYNKDKFTNRSPGSTDMGNVSHVVPAIHPLYTIPSDSPNHTKEFTVAAGSPNAQEPTLAAAKAMALTALKVLRCPETLSEIKRQFFVDLYEDTQQK